MRYVKGTTDYRLFYNKGESNSQLIGFSDIDFVGDISDQKSTSSHTFFLGGMAVSWSSQKQSIVALSSCKVKYIAAMSAACQGVLLKCLVSEMKGEVQMTIKLMVDNQSEITLSKNLVHHNQTKHKDITSFSNVLKIRRLKYVFFERRVT